MAVVRFTSNLMRHRQAPEIEAEGATLRELLDGALAGDPILRGYVLDDQGRVRKHVNVFVDGVPARDRVSLSDAVRPGAEVYVLQALTGG